ncbi:Response regulator [Ignavibacterium album JCM 16511]|uniref:Response regulator n=1 Tax=Ignavibacterium album (strain DSM 19864 / JCM 16511 / NBRC 101810 / Mat9-16) TaxID=945713 RepID=I0AGJ2_IGNAJ|nr:sigma-54 dependent transcriptional regulator [Ignavibacterium album]AFH48099.1 Response regulator [Ignavibacterium album JCM 16511]
MNSNKIKIKIFSDSDDMVMLNSALKQIELDSIPIVYTNVKYFVPEENAIIIIQPESLDSKMLFEIGPQVKEHPNKFLAVVSNNNALLVSTIVKFGINDVFVFPYEIMKFVNRLKELIVNKIYLTNKDSDPSLSQSQYDFQFIIGESPSFTKVVSLAKRVSENSQSNVLLLGETGTGKGIFARAIHHNSKFKYEPFVDIVCTAIPESLLESELFGYEAGAFTGARIRKYGLFEIAGNGTLFLDEIGDISLNLQAKLLRAIEKKVIKRIGGVVDIPINARIISATNKNLIKMVEEGSFRRDLYHRLNVVTIEIPPLRERREDIIPLADYFVNEFNREFGKSVKKVQPHLKHFLLGYTWPGNVRELRNAIERAVLLTDQDELKMTDFSNIIKSAPIHADVSKAAEEIPPQVIRLDLNYATTDLKRLSKYYAIQVLEKVGGNKSQAARFLGVSRPKLDALLSKKKR